MLPRPLLIAGLLLLTSLAGCIGGDEAPAANEAPDNSTDSNVTTDMPQGRDGEISAFKETNQTEEGVGGMSHDHDYWKGRERVVIMETSAKMDPRNVKGTEVQSGASAVFRIPPPGLVFEGTGKVEFTISNPKRHACEPLVRFPYDYICSSDYGAEAPDSNPPQGLTLEFMHAATSEWQSAGNLQWDTPLEIPIPDPKWTDMPHATASLWMFRVVSPNPQDTTLRFDASASIVKSGDVPMWPGHPEFYAEKTWRKVCDTCKGMTADGGLRGVGGTSGMETVVPEKVVSHGTETLYVWVNVTNFEGPEPQTWFFEWHNATGSWQYFRDGDAPFGETSYLWIVPVDHDGMDTPYADRSRWEFTLSAAYGAVFTCVGGCVPYKVDYTMDIVATNVKLSEEEYGLAEQGA